MNRFFVLSSRLLTNSKLLYNQTYSFSRSKKCLIISTSIFNFNQSIITNIISVSESHKMPRKSKSKQIAAGQGNGEEVVSKDGLKLRTDSEEEQESDEEVNFEKKSKSKKTAKSKDVKSKPKSKGKKYSDDGSGLNDEEPLETEPKSRKSNVKSEDEESKKRKRAADDEKNTSPKKNKKDLLNKVDTDIDSLNVTNTKCTADGKSSNFKIASWNVAGLRAWHKKGGLDYIKKELADIVCLQETKCSESKLPPEARVKGYHTYWCSGTKEGYAGVALYSKEKPLNVKYGLGKQEYDAEGRLITAEYEKFYVIAIYVPNAGSGLKNLSRRLQWDKDLRNYLKSLDEKKPVIVCGDMNVSHQPIDLANPKTNTKSAGFTQEERDGMTALLEAGFVDTFRHLYPDKTGAYTYWTYFSNARSRNVGWRLDYFVVSERFVVNVCDNVIRTEVYGSDHCPIVLFANV